MEEPVTLDSGEGTLEHSMHHHHQMPQPPPRHESYLMKQQQQQQHHRMNNNNHSHDGSGSENYEHLPTRSLNSLNGGGPDDSIKLNLNDNNEKYHLYHRNMMMGDNSYGGGADDDRDDKARLLHQGE